MKVVKLINQGAILKHLPSTMCKVGPALNDWLTRVSRKKSVVDVVGDAGGGAELLLVLVQGLMTKDVRSRDGWRVVLDLDESRVQLHHIRR